MTTAVETNLERYGSGPRQDVPCNRAWVDTRPLDVPVRRPHPVVEGVLPGTSVRLGRRRGRGGSGTVYRALDQATGRVLAVKVLREDRFAQCEGMLQEANILRTIESPWVVGFRSIGILPDGRPWLCMEYLEGRSLSRVLAERTRIDQMQVLRWFRQACMGLAAIHDAGWVHRDVKPSNLVYVDRPGEERLVIVDLGIAARIGTRPEMLCGTPEYIAPEQAQSKPVDLRSDIYALGCCVYKLLTGRPIVAKSSAIATINAHIEGVSLVWPKEARVPYVLRRIVERCLARAPEARPPNMYVLDDLLARACRELERRKRRLPTAPVMTVCEVSSVVQAPIVAANDEPTAVGHRPTTRAYAETQEGPGRYHWIRRSRRRGRAGGSPTSNATAQPTDPRTSETRPKRPRRARPRRRRRVELWSPKRLTQTPGVDSETR